MQPVRRYVSPMWKLVGQGRRRWLSLSTGVMLVAAVVLGAMLTGATANSGQDIAAIRQVCHDGLQAQLTLAIPSAPYPGHGPIPTDIQQQMLNHIPATLSNYYSEGRLAQLVSVLQNSVRKEADGKNRTIDGGVSSITSQNISIQGNSAVVTAQADTWAKFILDQGNGKVSSAEPHNSENWTWSLVKTNGQWRINGEHMDFLPGKGP